MVEIKLCGFTRSEDVALAARLPVERIGFITASDAKVRLSTSDAAKLAELLKTSRRGNQPRATVVPGACTKQEALALAALGFDELQVVYSNWFTPHLLDAAVVPVFFDADDVVQRIEAFRDSYGYQGLVCLDGALGGGLGQPASWKRAQRLATAGPLMLAGGLRRANVEQALREVRPAALDVCSGIESAPGQKSMELTRAFLAKVHSVEEV